MPPVRIHGRAWVRGLAVLLVGAPLAAAGLLVLAALAMGSIAAFPNVFLLGSLGLGAVALHRGFIHLRRRTLEIDDSGIRLLIGGHARWGVPWDHVRAVSSHARLSSWACGFVVTSGAKSYAVAQSVGFHASGDLREAFREAARRAFPFLSTMDDGAGWAPDLQEAFDHAARSSRPTARSLEGEWVGALDAARLQGTDFTRLGLMANLTALQVGMFSTAERGPVLVIPFGVILVTLLMLYGGDRFSVWWHLVSMRYGPDGVGFLYADGRGRSYAWRQIGRCGYDPRTCVLRLYLRERTFWEPWVRGGRFPRPFGEAVCARRAEAAAHERAASPR